MSKMKHNTLGDLLEKVWLVVEREHSNDPWECTDYHRETLLRKVYLTRASAENAVKSMIRARASEDGEIYGQHGTIHYKIVCASPDPGQDPVLLGESLWGPEEEAE